MLKKLCGLFLIISVCVTCISLLQCSDKRVSPTGGSNDLIGTWYSTAISVNRIITVNNVQTVVDYFSRGIGAINVTGDRSANLTCMMPSGSMVILSNQSIMDIYSIILSEDMSEVTYPTYILAVMEGFSMFIAMQSESDSVAYYGTDSGFAYNANNYSMTASNAALFTLDLSNQVACNGTLTSKVVSLLPNTPATIMSLDDPSNSSITATLDEDSTFVYEQTLLGETTSETGTWSISGNNEITLIATDQEGQQTETDTLVINYTLVNGELTFTIRIDECGGDTDCMSDTEDELDLEEGSLVSDVIEITATLSQTPPREVAEAQNGSAENQNILKSLKELHNLFSR